MTIFRKIGEALFGPDTSDQEYYNYVAGEIARGAVDQGIWTRSLADTNYDDANAKARYISIRVKILKQEVAALKRAEAQYESLRKRIANSYARRDYKTCIDALPRLAQHGDSWAQYLLATLYANGLGTERDNYRAYYWTYIARRSGYAEANELMGRLIPKMMSWEIKRAEDEATSFLQSQSHAIANR